MKTKPNQACKITKIHISKYVYVRNWTKEKIKKETLKKIKDNGGWMEM
jgi:hypothetical protein